MHRPTAIEALAATRSSTDFFRPTTRLERAKWEAMRYAVRRVAAEFAPGAEGAFEALRRYCTEEYQRQLAAIERP